MLLQSMPESCSLPAPRLQYENSTQRSPQVTGSSSSVEGGGGAMPAATSGLDGIFAGLLGGGFKEGRVRGHSTAVWEIAAGWT